MTLANLERASLKLQLQCVDVRIYNEGEDSKKRKKYGIKGPVTCPRWFSQQWRREEECWACNVLQESFVDEEELHR